MINILRYCKSCGKSHLEVIIKNNDNTCQDCLNSTSKTYNSFYYLKNKINIQNRKNLLRESRTKNDAILFSNRSFKPFKYPWAYEAWMQQQKRFWIPSEFDLKQDIDDWKNKLTASERRFFSYVLKFLTQMNTEVHRYYFEKMSQYISPIEFQMMIASFANAKAIHTEACHYIVSQLNLESDKYFYDRHKEYYEMYLRYEHLQQFNMFNKIDIAKGLFVMGYLVERIQFITPIILLCSFKKQGKMKVVSEILYKCLEDNFFHSNYTIRLYKEYLEENIDIKIESDTTELRNQILGMEMDFINSCFLLLDKDSIQLNKQELQKLITDLCQNKIKIDDLDKKVKKLLDI